MKRTLVTIALFAHFLAAAQVPETLVIDGVPSIPDNIKQQAGRYVEFRAAAFQDWHPVRREMLITTRFAESAQLHHVRMPGGARRQLTFTPEPVGGGSYQARTGDFIVYAQDQGGGEFYQFYRFDPSEGTSQLLTDGKSRNTGLRWSRAGDQFAYTSTRRNGKDTDIWLMNPAKPESNRLLRQVEGGGWSVSDWSHDDQSLLVTEEISINKSHIHLLDLDSGNMSRITPESAEPVAWANPRFSGDDKRFYASTDQDSEFTRLAEFDLPTQGAVLSKPKRILTSHVNWDIEQFEITRDGKQIAAVANENGIGVLRLFDAKSGKEKRTPNLPVGVLSNLAWHENGLDLAFNISSATAPLDVYSLDTRSGKLERWTESEAGGMDPSKFVQPELVTFKSFDGLPISAFIYRPDPKKFPGPRPALILIHGGPESQFRPGFLMRNNYYLNESGIAIIAPNVRGSSGYGKSFLLLDNGFKREDSVKDIGALLTYLRKDERLDPGKIAVMGGSYGGYMVLASMIHFGDQLRCGVDIVGISNFLTFLKNTQDYRRDLRRVEYGDERDSAMREFLERVSPTTSTSKIKKPLLVIQGKNDPRVPFTESEQMVSAIRQGGGTVWYLMANDEGHGFAKKRNVDYAFYATVEFLRQFLIQ